MPRTCTPLVPSERLATSRRWPRSSPRILPLSCCGFAVPLWSSVVFRGLPAAERSRTSDPASTSILRSFYACSCIISTSFRTLLAHFSHSFRTSCTFFVHSSLQEAFQVVFSSTPRDSPSGAFEPQHVGVLERRVSTIKPLRIECKANTVENL